MITHTEIRNFRSIERADIPLTGHAVLFGPNGAGKSSVLYALQMALFGACPLTTSDGKRASDLIREGAKFAEVTVTLDDGYTVEWVQRGNKSSLTIIEHDTGATLEIDRAGLWQRLGVSYQHARIAAMPAAYIDSQELSGALSDMLAAGGVEKLRALCGEYLDWIDQVADREGMRLRGIDDYRGFGDWAYHCRTEVRRELKEAEAEVESMRDVSAATDKNGNPATRESVEASLAKLRTTHDKLQRERGAAELAPDPTEIQEQIAEAERAREAAEAMYTEAQAAHTDAEAAQKQAAADDATAVAAWNQAERDLKTAHDALEKFDAATESECPTCGRDMDDDVRANIRASLLQAYDATDTAIDKAKQRRDETLRVLDEANKRLSAAKAELDDAQYKQRDATDAVHRLREQARVTSGRTVAKIDAELADTQASIERGEKLLQKCIDWAEKTGAETRVNHARAEIERLDWAVRAFRDGEILNQLMGDGLASFVAKCNAALEPFGLELSHAVDGKRVEFFINGRAVRLLSSGQRSLVQYAIATGFAGSVAPVLLDDINHLDATWRRTLLQGMDSGGQVLAACAWQQAATRDLSPVTRALPGADVFWVESGVVTRAE